MANNLIVYTVVHQPRRLKLPAQPIPSGASPQDIEKCLFDDQLNKYYLEKVARTCYRPSLQMFQKMLKADFKMSIGFSVSFLQQAEKWQPKLLNTFKEFAAHPNVELICVDPYHGFLCLLDIEKFIERMKWAQKYLKGLFGVKPKVTDTTEMFMSNDVYFALQKAGFKGAMIDGRDWVLEWREPTHLYKYGDSNLYLLTRHYELSDDIGYRFSNQSWSGWPLMAGSYAHWLKEARGDFVFLGWDFETFGEHHREDSGIFYFMEWLPGELSWRNITCLTPNEAINKYKKRSFDLALPEFGTTWAGSGGFEFFLGNSAQLAIFRLMHHVYNKAKLTENSDLIDLAIWLLQSENLHLIQWFGRSGEEAEVSAYFTPKEWWMLGHDRLILEHQQVYKNLIRALDYYL